MTDKEKYTKIWRMIELGSYNLGDYYSMLEDMGDMIYNYGDYVAMNVDKEIKRLPSANYHLCCCLLTLVLREDHFCDCFYERCESGIVRDILYRMIEVLKQNLNEEDQPMAKQYKLTDANGNIYLSDIPGEFGGNGKLKIYGRLDCGTALASMRRFPGEYQKHRVFFADEKTALAAGFRPCGNCLRKKYQEYMADTEAYKKKFGL